MKDKKSILIGLPQGFDQDKILQEQLEQLGFEVINISFPNHNFKYENYGQRICNFIRKLFLRDRNYKDVLKFNKFGQQASAILSRLNYEVDYALLIRGDVYPKKILQQIKDKSKKLVGYQWDGLHRFPAIFSAIKYFDAFYVFDPSDIDQYQKEYTLLPATNFYYPLPQSGSAIVNAKEIFFVGTFIEKRMHQITAFAEMITSYGYTPNFIIFTANAPAEKLSQYANPGIHFINDHLSYKETLQATTNATVLIDFLNSTHSGLSFRTFEAVGMDKKLITTNAAITRYDFYHPDNIYVIHEHNMDGLKDFLDKPYYPIDPAIKEKYSFINWVNYILGIAPHTPINLPKN